MLRSAREILETDLAWLMERLRERASGAHPAATRGSSPAAATAPDLSMPAPAEYASEASASAERRNVA